MLDDGSSRLLGALYSLLDHPVIIQERRNQSDGQNMEDNSNESSAKTIHEDILDVLGEYLAEMDRSLRNSIPIEVFADLITSFIPGTISECDFARLIFEFIEDNDIEATFQIQSLLSIIDFTVIPKHQLLNWILPIMDTLSPTMAISLNDIASISSPIPLRCGYTKEILSKENGSFTVLSCGCVMSKKSAIELCKKIQVKRTDGSEKIKSYFERKKIEEKSAFAVYPV